MYNRLKNKDYRLSIPEKITGRGLQFSPMRVAGKHVTNAGVDRITQSLYCLFSTRRGERLFQPEYGTRIYECQFEQNDFVFCDLVKFYAEEDIKLWEKRVTATVNVHVVTGTNRASLEIIYSIKGDSTLYSFQFPLNRVISIVGGDTFGE